MRKIFLNFLIFIIHNAINVRDCCGFYNNAAVNVLAGYIMFYVFKWFIPFAYFK